MNQEAIIRNAAEKANMPYPLDNDSQKLSESILRSLGEGMEIATGKKRGKSARDSVNELRKYIEEERARERK